MSRLICSILLAALAAPAAAAAPRKVGFIGCLAKPEDGELGTRISESLEQRLVRAKAPGFEFLHDVVARGRANLKGGPINPERVVAAGRAIGADKIIVCLITYKRERAATVPGQSKTTTVSRDETQYVEEEYYTEIPNPDYEPPTRLPIPVGAFGPVGLFVNVKVSEGTPKTIKERHVRRVPQTKTLYTEVTEPGQDSEKPGYVRLQAGYVIFDAASGKMEKRDTVSYVNELQAIFDAMETDADLRRKAADSTVESLEHSILAKLRPPSPPTD